MSSSRIIVLGSTGSIGTQTLEVVEHLNALHSAGKWPQRFEVVGLAAGTNTGLLWQQVRKLGVPHAAVGGLPSAAEDDQLPASTDCAVRYGADAAQRLVEEVECEIVVAAMTGAAGLPATLSAIERGRAIALANKETLVAAGELIVPAARRSGSRLLPVDSEHSALLQCLLSAGTRSGEGLGFPPFEHPPACVRRIILTASGGPFRTWSREQIDSATPEQALKHPTWNMGPKVTTDCASLINKGLEIIEAHWLFGFPADQIEVVIHPQSVVHSLVEYADGSTIAQLGTPDMRVPIQLALTFPERPEGLAQYMDWQTLRRLDFEPPDLERFPALALAYRAIREGGTAGAVLNAANEAAVERFLAGRLRFGEIPLLVARAMESIPPRPLRSLADCLEADAEARAVVGRFASSGVDSVADR